MEKRDYQVKAKRDIYRALTAYNRVVYTSPTGSGKSVVAIDIMLDAVKHNRNVYFLTERKTLKNQICEHCERNGIFYGVISGDDPRRNWLATVQVATVQTLESRSQFDKGLDADLFIYDECHMMRKHVYKLMQGHPNSKWLGLTATPWAANMGLWWDTIVRGPTVKELIKDGYLCDFQIFAPPSGQIDTKGVNLQAGEYNERQLYERANKEKLYANITSEWLRRGDRRPTLIFSTNIAHSKALRDRFRGIGESAEHIDAYTADGDAEDIIKAFRDNEVNVLCSVSKLAVGFNAPNAEVGIIARPTKSLMLHYQMMGRLLRPSPGKEKAIILDHSGNIENMGLPDSPPIMHLDTKGISDRKIRSEKDKVKFCSKCGSPKKGLTCTYCGHVSKPRPNQVFEKEGQLEELVVTKSRRLEWMQMLKHWEIHKGYKNGWSIFAFREKFGEDPKHKWVRNTKEPDEEVKKYIKYLQIKRAKSRRKTA